MPKDEVIMTEIREYAEEYPVQIRLLKEVSEIKGFNKGLGRYVIIAENEGGYNCTSVDLLDVLEWVKKHKPELLEKI